MDSTSTLRKVAEQERRRGSERLEMVVLVSYFGLRTVISFSKVVFN